MQVEIEVFTQKMLELAAHYGKDLKDQQIAEWVKQFSWMEPYQWDKIIAGARENCEHFPSGAYVYAQIRERKFSRRADIRQAQLISVECPGKSVVRDAGGKDMYLFRCSVPQCHAQFLSSVDDPICPVCKGEHKAVSMGAYIRECRATFVVTEMQCRVAVENGQHFICPNREHWECPVVFDGAVILEKQRNGVVYGDQFGRQIRSLNS